MQSCLNCLLIMVSAQWFANNKGAVRMKNWFLVIGCLLLVLSFSVGCGTSGGSEATTTTTTATTTSTTTTLAGGASISGQVAADAGDLSGLGIMSTAKPKFRTLANSVMAGATVKLYQIGADGAETYTGKLATADASGNYTIADVTPLTAGIYKVEATKTVGSNTVKVETLSVVNSVTAETANIAPETSIAAAMFDDVIKQDFTKVIVNQNTMGELQNLVVDDTENLVNNGQLALPSMTTSNNVQVGLAASGIAENKGNADKAFKKVKIENMGNTAKLDSNLNLATKYLNEVTITGPGQGYILPKEATKAMGQAYINSETKTITEVVNALSQAAGTSINSANVVNGLNQQLAGIKTKYDSLVAGSSDALITEPEYMVFNAGQTLTLTATSTLEVSQQLAVENYIKQNILPQGTAVDEIKFIDQLGYITAGSGIATNEPFFQEINLYYGSYGGWKLGGGIQLYFPTGSGITATAVNIRSSDGTTKSLSANAPGSTMYTLASETGPTVVSGTNYFTLEATLSNSALLTKPVTIEMVEIPEPTVQRIDGSLFENLNSPVPYYQITTVSDKRPIIKWSTSEVAVVTIPTGYAWAYALEVSRYGTTVGATTLEVDDADNTPVYATGTDMAKLLTNNSFLMPVDLSTEVSGEKVAYRLYVQRILLNPEGRFNGIAAGAFRFLRYVP